MFVSVCQSLAVCPMLRHFSYTSHCLSLAYSVRMFIGLFTVCLSVYLSVCLSTSLSVCLSVWLLVCFLVCLSICSSISLSVCLSIGLSIDRSVYRRLSICL